MRWILLPGLDGTGRLFRPLLQQVPAGIEATAIRYPIDRAAEVEELQTIVDASLPHSEPYVLFAESFSGPIALHVAAAAAYPPVAVVLCASFGRCPVSPVLLHAAAAMAGIKPPSTIARWLLMEGAGDGLVAEFQQAIRSVQPSSLRRRFRVLHRFGDAPAALNIPVLCLRATRDRLISAAEGEWLAKRYAQMKTVDIDGPHLLAQCRPVEVARAIAHFTNAR